MSMLGTSVVRKEDPELLTAGGKYVDDLPAEGALHAVFVRSMVAHGELGEIDISDAAGMPGVVGIFTAADLDLQPRPPGMPMFNKAMTRTFLAAGRVRYVGEPVAVVVAETHLQAADAAEMVYPDIDMLDAVVSVHDAVKDEVVIHPDAGTNTVFGMPASGDDVFANCDVTVELSFRNNRLAPCPLEPRATIASVGTRSTASSSSPSGRTNQGAHGTRDGLAAARRTSIPTRCG